MQPSGAPWTIRAGVVAALAVVLACGGGGGGAGVQGPPGDIRFGTVVLPTEGQAGHPVELTAELLSETDKLHVTVRLSLVRSDDPSTVDPFSEQRTSEWVWGTVVEKVTAGEPLTIHEVFDLPPALPAGDYAAVLEINAVDFTAADDALQGEEPEHRENNVLVGPALVTVTAPPLPDLDLPLVQLDRYGFDLGDGETFGAEEELFGAAVTVIARTHDVAGPVSFRFELGIPGAGDAVTWHPLDVGTAGAGDQYAGPLAAYLLGPEPQLDDQDVPHTVALLANRPRTFQVGLHPPAATRAALEALEQDTECTLRVLADANDRVAEIDELDNVLLMPLTFFPDGVEDGLTAPPSSSVAPGVRAPYLLRAWDRKQGFGNHTFAGRYAVDAAFSLAPPAGAEPADARNIRFTSAGTGSLTLLGSDFTAVDARAVANLDLDDGTANVFAATVDAFGARVLSERHVFDMEAGEVVLYDHQKELYSASKTKKQDFLLGGVVPMTVKGTARVSLGLRGRVTAGPDRRMTIGIGPYVDATGTTDATVHLGIADGGVTGNLRFLYYDELYDNAIVLTDDLAKQYQFGETFHLRTLDGDVYLHARTSVGCGTLGLHACHFKKTLLDWKGYAKTYTVPIATADLAP